MILMMHAHPRAERPGSAGRRVLCWKRAEFVVTFLTLMGAQPHWNVAIASTPKVSSLKDGGGGDARIDLGGVRPPGAPFQGPWTDRSKIISSEQIESVKGNLDQEEDAENYMQDYDHENLHYTVDEDGDVDESVLDSVLNVFERKSRSLVQSDPKPTQPATESISTKKFRNGITSDLLSLSDSPSDSLLLAHDIAKTALANIVAIKKSYEDGDAESFGSVIKSVLDGVEPLTKVGKRRGIDPPAIDTDAFDKALSLKGMSSTEFTQHLSNYVARFEMMEEHAKGIIDALEKIDMTLITPPEKLDMPDHLRDDFEFEPSPNFKDDIPESFEQSPPAHSWRNQQYSSSESSGHYNPKTMLHTRFLHKSFSAHLTSWHLGKMGSFSSEEAAARHDMRISALGDSCPKKCESTDTTCTCDKLFQCVSRLSAYDLASLLSSGYVESELDSESYGKFTVDSADLKLFNAEDGGGLGSMLEKIKEKAKASGSTSSTGSITTCKGVLQEFHLPCESSRQNSLCTKPNTQSYQATVEQICDAVDTSKKLRFDAIGAEFDSFVEVSSSAVCPTSYATCGEFVKVFDNLYQLRDKSKYPLANPMRKNPSVNPLQAGVNVFQHVEFPSKYVMHKDVYGVSQGFQAVVTFVHDSGKMMSVMNECDVGSNCVCPGLVTQSDGCHKIQEEDECLMSMDGRVNFQNQQCAWCTRGTCQSNKSFRCEPVGWLENLGNIRYHTATCLRLTQPPGNQESNCIVSQNCLNNRFILVADRIVSARFPTRALHVNDCIKDAPMFLKHGGTMQWRFTNDQIVSIDCPGYVITSDNENIKLMDEVAAASIKWTMTEIEPPRIITHNSTNKVISVNKKCVQHKHNTNAEAYGKLRIENRHPGEMRQQFYVHTVQGKQNEFSFQSVLCPSLWLGVKNPGCDSFNDLYDDASHTKVQKESWLATVPEIEDGVEAMDKDERKGHTSKDSFVWTFKNNRLIKSICPLVSNFIIGPLPDTGGVTLQQPDFRLIENKVRQPKWKYFWSWNNLDRVFTLDMVQKKQSITLPFKEQSECDSKEWIKNSMSSGALNQQFSYKQGRIISVLCPNKVLSIRNIGKGDDGAKCTVGEGENGKRKLFLVLSDIDNENCVSCKWKFDNSGLIISDGCIADVRNDYQIPAVLFWDGLAPFVGGYTYGKLDSQNQLDWRLDKANFELSFDPKFTGHPTQLDKEGCMPQNKGDVDINKRLASNAMTNCDKSMELLAGSMSLGTLTATVEAIKGKGPGKMPGTCCLDNALNAKHLGFNYDPTTMTCVDRGQWHLGLAEEICEAAGGQWTRTPCSTLKGCIDDRPKRFDFRRMTDFDALTQVTANFDHVVAPMDAAGWLEKFGQGSSSYKGYRNLGMGLCTKGGKGYDRLARKTIETESCADLCGRYESQASYRGFDSKKLANGKYDCRCNFDQGTAPAKNGLHRGNGASGEADGLTEVHKEWLCYAWSLQPSYKGYRDLGVGLCTKGGKGYDRLIKKSISTENCADLCGEYKSQISYRGFSSKQLDNGKYDCRCNFDKDKSPTNYDLFSGNGGSGEADGTTGTTGWSCYAWGQLPNMYGSEQEGTCTQGGKTYDAVTGDTAHGCIEFCSQYTSTPSYRGYSSKTTTNGKHTCSCFFDNGVDSSGVAINAQGSGASGQVDGANGAAGLSCHPFRAYPLACHKFCSDLPGYELQTGMMMEQVNDKYSCICLYENGKAPKRDKVPDYAAKKYPGFHITDPDSGAALGLPPGSKCDDIIGLETQAQVDGMRGQEFQVTYDGRLINLACPQHALTATSNGVLKAMKIQATNINMQRWTFSKSEMVQIQNVHYSSLISAQKKKTPYKSQYFALVNPTTNLAIGVDGKNGVSSCANGVKLVLQNFEEGNPHQNFKFSGNRMTSMLCPNLGVGHGTADCVPGTELKLLSSPGGSWKITRDSVVDIECGDNIGIGIARPMSDKEEKNTQGTYNQLQRPEVGASIILSTISTPKKHQKWTKKIQQYQDLLGPFHFIHSGGDAISAPGDCQHGMKLITQTYHADDSGQKFYIGKHGSLFSVKCGGFAIGVVGSDCAAKKIGLQLYQTTNKGMKWKLREDGAVESVLCGSSTVIGQSGNDVTLSSSNTARWRRENTKLLDTQLKDWTSGWEIKFVEEGYSHDVRGYTAATKRYTYGSNVAFSPSFETFSKGLVVTNDKNEEDCRTARKGLGYDMDYPYDTELCQTFKKWLCEGKSFSASDVAEDLKEGKVRPKREFKPIEYEKVEYNPVAYEAPVYDDDPQLPFKPIKDGSEWKDAEAYEGKTYEWLGHLQDAWLGANAALSVAEKVFEFKEQLERETCEAQPDVIPAPMTCLPNLPKTICKIVGLVIYVSSWAGILAMTIAENVLFNVFEKLTEGPNGEIYANDASKMTYENLKHFVPFTEESLKAINENIKNQHTDMRQHLQNRHLALETNIGQELVEAQNALDEGIVNAQNANGQLIADAQNSINGKLCKIFNEVAGVCDRMIGPLEEGKLIIPFDFYVPDNHVSLTRTFQEKNELMEDKMEKMQEKIDLMEDKMEKILAMEGKVDSTEVKVSEIKEMLANMMDMMG